MIAMVNISVLEIDDEGRIKLPQEILEKFGLQPRSKVLLELKKDGIRLSKYKEREEFIELFCGAVEGEDEDDLDLKSMNK